MAFVTKQTDENFSRWKWLNNESLLLEWRTQQEFIASLLPPHHIEGILGVDRFPLGRDGRFDLGAG